MDRCNVADQLFAFQLSYNAHSLPTQTHAQLLRSQASQ